MEGDTDSTQRLGRVMAEARMPSAETDTAEQRSSDSVFTQLHRISEKAKQDPALRFTSLAHLLTIEMLSEAFGRLRKDASPLAQSHYDLVVSALQVAGGVLLLLNRYVPLALVLLGPVIVNIVLFHLLMDPSGLPFAIPVVILWGIVFFRHRQYFSSIFVRRAS